MLTKTFISIKINILHLEYCRHSIKRSNYVSCVLTNNLNFDVFHRNKHFVKNAFSISE